MSRRANEIDWTAREAFAVALCWSGFSSPQEPDLTPEAYWLRISEQARNGYRRSANDRLLLAVARGDAVAVLPTGGLREGEFAALKQALGMKSEHRVRSILDAVRSVFRRSTNLTPPAEIGGEA